MDRAGPLYPVFCDCGQQVGLSAVKEEVYKKCSRCKREEAKKAPGLTPEERIRHTRRRTEW